MEKQRAGLHCFERVLNLLFFPSLALVLSLARSPSHQSTSWLFADAPPDPRAYAHESGGLGRSVRNAGRVLRLTSEIVGELIISAEFEENSEILPVAHSLVNAKIAQSPIAHHFALFLSMSLAIPMFRLDAPSFPAQGRSYPGVISYAAACACRETVPASVREK